MNTYPQWTDEQLEQLAQKTREKIEYNRNILTTEGKTANEYNQAIRSKDYLTNDLMDIAREIERRKYAANN